jgi:hypothetical protein
VSSAPFSFKIDEDDTNKLASIRSPSTTTMDTETPTMLGSDTLELGRASPASFECFPNLHTERRLKISEEAGVAG